MGRPRIPLSPPRKSDKRQFLSHQSLPPLVPLLSQRLLNAGLEFPINDECTSLALVPSGRHIVGGFTDGTLRVFDLTGKFHSFDRNHDDNEGLFDSDSSSDEDNEPLKTTGSITALVCSKSNQRYGTVACQIHAKGVHTSLQMTVGVSPDGLYAFGGVARGSMELVAVDLRKLEQHHDVDCTAGLDLLDLMDVHRHSDAKLRGFGACTRLQRRSDEDDTYILLTGKGIKNIHIWSFTPSQEKWMCLYDTQSNGNSISILHLRYSPSGALQAISKSDRQKLRVWDLSGEQRDNISEENRPKRPPYKDIRGTESVLGIGGDFGIGGQFQQLNLVNLNIDPPFNITEVALPATGDGRRQQRGELKSLQGVAGMDMDGSHVLLEMTDSSVMHLSFQDNSVPQMTQLDNFGDVEGNRTLAVARIGSEGVTVAAMASTYSGKGRIMLHQIGEASLDGHWGFHGVGTAFNKNALPSPEGADQEAIAQAAGSLVNRFKKRLHYESMSDADSVASPEIFPKTPNATNVARNVSPASSIMTPGVPISAVKACNSSVIKAGVATSENPEPSKIKSISISPESVNQSSSPIQQSILSLAKKKKKKRRISQNGREENKLEKRKLVLHIRKPKELSQESNDKPALAKVLHLKPKSASVEDAPFKDQLVHSVQNSASQIEETKTKCTGSTAASDLDKVSYKVPTLSNAPLNPSMSSRGPDNEILSNATILLKMNAKTDTLRKCAGSQARKLEAKSPNDEIKEKDGHMVAGSASSTCTVNNASKQQSIPLDTGAMKQDLRSGFVPQSTEVELKSSIDEITDKGCNEAFMPVLTTHTIQFDPNCKKNEDSRSMGSALSILMQKSSLNEQETNQAPKPPTTQRATDASSSGWAVEIVKKVKAVKIKNRTSLAADSGSLKTKHNGLMKKRKLNSFTKQTTAFLTAVEPKTNTDLSSLGSRSKPQPVKKRKVDSIPKSILAEPEQPQDKNSRVIEANLGRIEKVSVSKHFLWKLNRRPIAGRFEVLPSSTCESEVKRIKMVLEHRASHESLRKKVLDSVALVIKSMVRDRSLSMEDAKGTVEEAIAGYSDLLDMLLFRQSLEASALAATLSLPVPPTVSFPFPEVFEQARKTLAIFLENRETRN